MSLFPERTGTAVVVVDAQQGVAEQLWEVDRATAAIATLIARARLAGTPVVWSRRADASWRVGEPAWQLVDALVPEPAEAQLEHVWDDCFVQTHLAQVLGGLGVGHIYLAGFGSDTAVLHTYLGALHRGFDVTLVEDGHAAAAVQFDGCRLDAAQVVAFVNRIVWRDVAPDVTGDLMASANVVFTRTEPDDDELIEQADAETRRLEAAADDIAAGTEH